MANTMGHSFRVTWNGTQILNSRASPDYMATISTVKQAGKHGPSALGLILPIHQMQQGANNERLS